MIGHEFPLQRADDAIRVVRALGAHRYIAGRTHLAHAFALVAAVQDPAALSVLQDASAWASALLDAGAVDPNSKDPALFRTVTDAELQALLGAFWQPGPARERVHDTLRKCLGGVDGAGIERVPFDEATEEDIFPVLVDAGWELLKLAELDAERHKGVIGSFEDFEVARFDEASMDAEEAYLHELPLLGADELLRAVDEDGAFRQPFVIFTQAPEPYDDYLLRGVERAAKLSRDE